MDVNKLMRENIKNLKSYSSARSEFRGEAAVFLDANENPYNSPYNRYPDPLQMKLKKEIGQLKGFYPENIFLGNGSDEAIDLILRAFCTPGKDEMISLEPSYGMYKVLADINEVKVRSINLNKDFSLPVNNILKHVTKKLKVIFICSPNNPTSNCFDHKNIEDIITNFDGIVVIDEAYIDFAPDKSLLHKVNDYSNLIVLHTFSKAWGMAGIRLGMAFSSPEIIEVLNKIKYPYNVNTLTANFAMERIKKADEKDNWVKTILKDREELRAALMSLEIVEKIYPSDANFLLVKMTNAKEVYDYLVEKKIIVRDRSNIALCEGSLRITVGKKSENILLVSALRDYYNHYLNSLA